MSCAGSGSLPFHQYVWVDRSFIRKGCAHQPLGTSFERAVWFGLHAQPSRAWGCQVLLECGALYRDLPPHALAFDESPRPDWTIRQAQRWDCYGHQFSLLRYDYLAGLSVVASVRGEEIPGLYLFTAVPIGDAFSEEPEQSKEFLFIRTAQGRLTIQPSNAVLVREPSFTEPAAGWPTDLERMTRWWSCEACGWPDGSPGALLAPTDQPTGQ